MRLFRNIASISFECVPRCNWEHGNRIPSRDLRRSVQVLLEDNIQESSEAGHVDSVNKCTSKLSLTLIQVPRIDSDSFTKCAGLAVKISQTQDRLVRKALFQCVHGAYPLLDTFQRASICNVGPCEDHATDMNRHGLHGG